MSAPLPTEQARDLTLRARQTRQVELGRGNTRDSNSDDRDTVANTHLQKLRDWGRKNTESRESSVKSGNSRGSRGSTTSSFKPVPLAQALTESPKNYKKLSQLGPDTNVKYGAQRANFFSANLGGKNDSDEDYDSDEDVRRIEKKMKMNTLRAKGPISLAADSVASNNDNKKAKDQDDNESGLRHFENAEEYRNQRKFLFGKN